MLKFNILFIISCLLLITGCKKEEHTSKSTEIKVVSKSITEGISHIGIVEPIHSAVIISPSNGFVTDLKTDFGQYVKKGSPLVSISDNELVNELFSSVSEYLLNQKAYSDAKNTLEDKQSLLEAGVLAKIDVNNAELDFQRAKIALLKSEFHLQNISKKLNQTSTPFKSFSLDDLSTFYEKIDDQASVTINAPNEGYFIPANIISLDEQIKPISIGSKVESGIAIGAIADLKHIKITIQVNEFEINQITVNMPVEIASVANPNKKISGRVDAIDLFRFKTRLDEPTVYPVTIYAETDEIINAGTRWKVSINASEKKVILIPIDAVYDVYTSPYVILKNGTKQMITIGKTHFNGVEVIAGLQEGDIILKSTK
tara:strand:+ start:4947 stop:6059 length:1113 start_codon:yes stop_codon:yes gene_type:complete